MSLSSNSHSISIVVVVCNGDHHVFLIKINLIGFHMTGSLTRSIASSGDAQRLKSLNVGTLTISISLELLPLGIPESSSL